MYNRVIMPSNNMLPLVLIAMATGFLAAPACAQDTGAIFGAVTDATGAVVPGAKLKLVNTDTNLTLEAASDAQGEYVFTPVRIGNYRIEVSMQGFTTAVRGNVILNVQQRMRLDFALELGSVGQSVEIKAESPLLETGTSSIGQVIKNNAIMDLPLNGRDYQQLAVLTAGTVPTGGISRGNSDFAANGARPLSNNFVLDGVDNNSYVLDLQSFSSTVVTPSIDALQEFKVQNNNFSAEFGRYGGAVINTAIKSGTNELHGSLFEFLRNSALDANNFFNNRAGRSLPPFRQNQFGGTLGGPLVKNKLFLFASYQGTRIAQGVTAVSTVPLDSERNGIFTAPIFDPATTRGEGAAAVRDPFPGNRIPAERFDPVGVKVANVYPSPNLAGGANNFILNPGNRTSADQYDARFDWNVSSSDMVFGRYSLSDQRGISPGPLPLPAVGQVSSAESPTVGHSAVLNETHTFSPRMINELRLGFNRLDTQRRTGVRERLIEEFGFKGIPYYSDVTGLPTISVTGYQGVGENDTLPNLKLSQVFQFTDSVSIIRGGHTFKAGGDMRWIISNAFTPSGTRGSFAFSGVFTQNPQKRSGTGSGMADLLLGTVGSAGMNTPTIGELRQHYYGFYLQDDWQVSNKLTVNLGFRWDFSSPFWDHRDRMSNFIIEPGSPDFGTFVLAGSRGDSVEDRALVRFYRKDVAPRLGLAYRLPRKTVVRASYGIFNSGTTLFGINGRLSYNPPFNAGYNYSSDQLYPKMILGDGFAPGVLRPVVDQVNRNIISFDPNMRNGYMQQWSFNVQNELLPNMLVDVAYSASVGHKLMGSRNANQPRPGPGATQPRSPFPQFVNINRVEDYGNSSYHALEAKVERRFSGGASFLVAYTWSHFLDAAQTALDLRGAGIQDAFNLRAEKGNANYDVRHRFVSSYNYELPAGRGKRFLNTGPASQILGGWSLNGILSVQAGRPFTPTLNFNAANAGGSQRPDRIASGVIDDGSRGVDRWFDTAAFVAPTGYAFGNSGRNILTGPRLFQWDFSLFKNFLLRERFRVQLRLESFNVLNHPNFDLPAASIGTKAAGTISANITSPRQNQVAMKMVF